jgi:hypothetical protein
MSVRVCLEGGGTVDSDAKTHTCGRDTHGDLDIPVVLVVDGCEIEMMMCSLLTR